MYSNRHSLVAVALAALAQGSPFPELQPRLMPPTARTVKRPRTHNYTKPHQGKRECARRRGGDDWAAFRAADRVRRGLPVSWLYSGGEG